MFRNWIKTGLLMVAVTSFSAFDASAESTIKVGLIMPMTGQYASVGKQVVAAARLYIAQHGTKVAGKNIELIAKDDGGLPDATKRIAKELLVNEKVSILAGMGLTPLAFAVAPLATEAKVSLIDMVAAAGSVTEKSPYIVRVSFTLPQHSVAIADWAAKNGSKRAVTLVSDYAPGVDAETFFKARFIAAGGEIVDSLRVPLTALDFAPFLQRARDAAPDTIFVFIPSGRGGSFVRQFLERGLDKSGIRLVGTADLTDDDELNGMGDEMIGTVTAGNYSTAHPSAANKAYVKAFKEKNSDLRPNFISLGGYDGMHLIYEALKKTGGKTDGDSLVAAMKGMAWESPRGPIAIDPETRDIVQNIYIRRVEKVNGQLYNVEFATFEAVKDPGKAKK
ncbi:MAG: ABC transporter substrate-binding protein [Xanthobacteraceae bacterium]|nr:MAG: ABC transporter substrate-binding protein [Xanthobacteraceae bacterium]